MVTGASRGFGLGITQALVTGGVEVVGVARDRAALEAVRDRLGDLFVPVAGDPASATLAGMLIDVHRPRTLILNAGADPLTVPAFLQGLGPVLSIEEVGRAVLELTADGSADRPAYALDPSGLRPLG